MQILKIVGGMLGLVMIVALTVTFLPQISTLSHNARSEAISQTNLTCTASDNQCAISLTNEHVFSDTSNMVVTDASTGLKHTDDTAVGNDRTTLTITSLTNSQSYNFTVDYFKIKANVAVATGLSDILNLMPFLFVLVLLVAGVILVGAGFSAWGGRLA